MGDVGYWEMKVIKFLIVTASIASFGMGMLAVASDASARPRGMDEKRSNTCSVPLRIKQFIILTCSAIITAVK